MTIPKFELLAMLIGVRGAQFVIKQMELENNDHLMVRFQMCITLDTKSFSPITKLLPKFIQNRVQGTTGKSTHFYISSEFNPAHIATRGFSPLQDLITHKI